MILSLGRCFAAAFMPPHPADLINKYSIIATVKVSAVTDIVSGSGFWHSQDTPVEVLMARLHPLKILKGRLSEMPIVIQTLGETVPLKLDREYLIFLNQDEWRYIAKNVFPITKDRVHWYSSTSDIALGTAPTVDEIPLDHAVRQIESIVKKAEQDAATNP
jgi:hypothetical protein